MNIYFIVDIALAILALTYNEKNAKQVLFLSFGLLLFLLCFHNGESDTDYPHYIGFFKGNGSMYGSIDGNYELELPYFIYCKLLDFLFTRSDFVYIFFTGLFCGLPLCFCAKQKSSNYALTIFLLFTLLNTETYLFVYAAHRQMLANAFIFSAYLIAESQIKRKYYFASLFLIIAFYAHSSSFFIIPVLSIVYFYKWEMKKQVMIIAILITMVFGILANSLFGEVLTQLAFLFDGFENAERTISYLTEDVYEIRSKTTFNILAPLSFLALIFLFLSNDNERDSFCMKLLVIATCVYNLFSFIPLVDRSVTTLLLFGICGAIPRQLNNRKILLAILLIMYLYLAYKAYNSPVFRLLPFHFIWE